MVDVCKMCAHAHPHPNGDLRVRVCRGGPPQIVVVPIPGGAAPRQFWPEVRVSDPVCGAYKRKSFIELDGTDASGI